MRKLIIRNKKANFNYEILDTLEAGIVLKGFEVKSIRDGKISIQESHAKIISGELWLVNANINKYKQDSSRSYDPIRTRKLLVSKKQLSNLIGKVQEKGLALVPLAVYLKDKKLVKIDIGIGRGKKVHDKRETIKRRDEDRDMKRRFGN